MDTDDINGQLNEALNAWDQSGEEIHIFTNISRRAIEPTEILYELDKIYDPEKAEDTYIFLTNIGSLFQIVYRIYHQVFHKFVFFQQEASEDITLSEVYKNINSRNITEQELLYKPVYSNEAIYP
jgi:hypothetical protein